MTDPQPGGAVAVTARLIEELRDGLDVGVTLRGAGIEDLAWTEVERITALMTATPTAGTQLACLIAGPFRTDDGPCLVVNLLHLSRRKGVAWLEALGREVQRAGVQAVVIDTTEPCWDWQLESIGPTVVMQLYVAPRGRAVQGTEPTWADAEPIRHELTAIAERWLRPASPLSVCIGGAPLRNPVGEIADFLALAGQTTSVGLVASDDQLRPVLAASHRPPRGLRGDWLARVTFPLGGPAPVVYTSSGARVGAQVEQLVEQAISAIERLAPQLGYAFVAVLPDRKRAMGPFYSSEPSRFGWPRPDGTREPDELLAVADFARRLFDEMAVDAFHYQLLGPRHLERLGGVPTGAETITPERWAVRLGTPAEWLDPDTRPAHEDHGRLLLHRLLHTDESAELRLREIWDASQRLK